MVSGYVVGGVAGFLLSTKINKMADKVSAKLSKNATIGDIADSETVLMAGAGISWYVGGTMGDGAAAALAVALVTRE